MTLKLFYSIAVLSLVSACATPGPIRVVQPLPITERGQVRLAKVDVTISPIAAELVLPHDEKAVKTVREGETGPDGRIAREDYDTLPLVEMFPLVMQDVLRERGIAGDRAVHVEVTVHTLKTANPRMAWLAGSSSDQLAGLVAVHDAASGEKLSEFYIDVVNSHGGLFGMAIRGGGIRERLVAEFAGHVADQLAQPEQPRS